MKRRLGFAFALVALLACGAADASAQARRVRLKIDGYLCGN